MKEKKRVPIRISWLYAVIAIALGVMVVKFFLRTQDDKTTVSWVDTNPVEFESLRASGGKFVAFWAPSWSFDIFLQEQILNKVEVPNADSFKNISWYRISDNGLALDAPSVLKLKQLSGTNCFRSFILLNDSTNNRSKIVLPFKDLQPLDAATLSTEVKLFFGMEQ